MNAVTNSRRCCSQYTSGVNMLPIVVALLWSSVFATFTINATHGSHMVLPHPCDQVKCPPMAEISCPADSEIRDSFRALSLLMAGPSEEPLAINGSAMNGASGLISTTEMAEDMYAECCLAKKCTCRTCYIPGCSDTEVVVEIVPEAMVPGQCCGQYECHMEPNCTEVRETDSHWLTDCKRCRCYAGERICHQSCDEGLKRPTAICTSKNLNKFFEHGDMWKDGCYECECVNGEEKCVMPFCRSVNCPLHRQVLLKDSCCPICWPKGIPMPHGDEDYDEDTNINKLMQNYDDDEEDNDDGGLSHLPQLPLGRDEYGDNEVEPLPNINFESDLLRTTTSTALNATSTTPTTTATITTSTTEAPTVAQASSIAPQTEETAQDYDELIVPNETPSTAGPPPCTLNARHEPPATYQIYPVDVGCQTCPINWMLCGIIIVLFLCLISCGIWNYRLRAKQRSYRPVSHTDDNFNKTINIKETNESA